MMLRKQIAFLAAVLFAAFAYGLAANAEGPPVCNGKDLIAELKTKDPAAYERLKAEAAKIPNGDAVFWRIDGPPGTPPSWLLGTIHLSDPRLVNLEANVANALDKASVLAIETRDSLTPEEAQESSWQSARYVVLPVGTSLFDLMSEKDARLLREKLTAIGLDPDVFFPYQPWVVYDFVTYPTCERARWQAGFQKLDLSIAFRALSNSKPVIGLEDPVAQAALFASIPMQNQVADLAAALRVKHTMEDDVETAVVNWRNGQIAMLYDFSNGYDQLTEAELAAAKRAEAYFLDKRNVIMRDNAMPLLEKGNAFIAVGVFHLIGENGLVELLRKAGYKVSPVK
ncbi:MAG: TraB/GumN family protein [Rhizobiales bacterium]|nr:TraB/GumN family protein [Hyphomicrobiales bacterium]